MTPGSIVVVDWRDALPATGEPGKQRPAVVIGRSDLFHQEFGYLLVVPLTSDAAMCISEASLEIAPTKENHCKKRCFALSWSVQTIPKRRARATEARVAREQLDEIRDQIARLVER
ncbi:MAG TPA: type II toxin-antitoxin system PemK/MazF family toxin [Candidatus Baltobacteraceae bacterium]|nr:type II toxin-antitoxin system PemK/MazF family toxin [Candidatus Baltobacteraceae bacterium]